MNNTYDETLEQISNTLPREYRLADQAIYIVCTKKSKDEDAQGINTFVGPIMYIKAKVLNNDTNKYNLLIEVIDDGTFKETLIPRDEMNRNGILKIASDTGANVTLTNAKAVLDYLSRYEEENKLEVIHSQSTFGWTKDSDFKEFLPYLQKTQSATILSGIEADELHNFNPKGTKEEWIENIWKNKLEKNNICKFFLGCSVCAPLLSPIKERSFTAYIWNASGSGKTALLKAVLSIWGNPDYLITSFNSTENAILSKIATLKNIPVGVDEKQQATENFNIQQLVYCIGNEQPKGRCNILGKVRKAESWRTVVFATGEEPLDLKDDGAVNRCLQIKGKPFESEEDAIQTHNDVALYYGAVGTFLIECFSNIENLSDYKERFLKNLEKQLSNEQNLLKDKNRFNKCGIVALALFLFETLVLDLSSKQALEDTANMTKEILEQLLTNKPKIKNFQALEYLYDQYTGNPNKFYQKQEDGKYHSQESTVQMWGKVDDNSLMFINSVYKDILNNGGFNPKSLSEYMKENELIELDDKGQNPVDNLPPNNASVRLIRIKLEKLKTHLGIK